MYQVAYIMHSVISVIVWLFDRFSIIVPLIVSIIWSSESCHQRRLHSTNKRMRIAHTHLPHIHQFFIPFFSLFKIKQTHQISHSLIHFIWFGCSFFQFWILYDSYIDRCHHKFCLHCISSFTFWVLGFNTLALNTCFSFLIHYEFHSFVSFLFGPFFSYSMEQQHAVCLWLSTKHTHSLNVCLSFLHPLHFFFCEIPFVFAWMEHVSIALCIVHI